MTKKGVSTFLRAQLSALAATAFDFAVTLLLARVAGVYYVWATLAGNISGGIFNCIVNYKWVFGSGDSAKWRIGLKYAVVWLASIALNTGGTYAASEFVFRWYGSAPESVFVLCKLVVALLVAFLWNYNMQRIFVYRNTGLSKIFKAKTKDEIEG